MTTIATVLFLGLVSISSSRASEPKAVARPTPAPAPVATATATPVTMRSQLDPVLREAFMSGCTESGDASLAYCECALDHMERRHGSDALLDIMGDSTSATYQEMVTEAAKACLDLN